MKFKLQGLTNSRFGVRFGLWLGRSLPLKAAYAVANTLAYAISSRDNAMTRAVRANQWVVRGENTTPEELDQAVQEVFQHAGRCFVDLYSNLTNPEKLKELAPLIPAAEELILHGKMYTQGAFIVAPHMSAFDLVLLAMAYHGLEAKVLTYSNPTGGYEIQNEIRASTGLDITPVRGPKTEKELCDYMRSGGIAVTGVDRPIRRKSHRVTFFGRPSPLPTGHIRMALEADVPVVVAAVQYQPDGKYHLQLSKPIYMERYGDRSTTIRLNAEAVLRVIEGYISQAPSQWLMYYPVWPEVNV